MTVWLCRQEAIACRASYIDWVLNKEQCAPPTDPSVEDDDVDEESKAESGDNRVANAFQGPNLDDNRHGVAQTPSLKGVSVAELESKFGTMNFIPELTTFLSIEQLLWIRPTSTNDTFNVYKHMTVSVPANPYHYSRPVDCIRATPPEPAQIDRRRKAVAGHFDTALIIMDPENYRLTDGMKGERRIYPKVYTSEHIPSGLRVGRIHVIFNLPRHFGHVGTPLAYVEWFTEFQRRDSATGQFRVKPAMRKNGIRKALIIRADRILHACHLLADPGTKLGGRWTSDDALDHAPDFLFNDHYTIDLFAFVRFPSIVSK
jgi:hypothetical protein